MGFAAPRFARPFAFARPSAFVHPARSLAIVVVAAMTFRCTPLKPAAASVEGSAVPAVAMRDQPADTLASRGMEVRLRKLHLVRPDLIPYPIAYDVYC